MNTKKFVLLGLGSSMIFLAKELILKIVEHTLKTKNCSRGGYWGIERKIYSLWLVNRIRKSGSLKFVNATAVL